MKEDIVNMVRWYIYDDVPDWGGLCLALVELGLSDSQVFNICYDVRKGGDGTEY